MDSQDLQKLKNKYDIIGNDPALARALETAVAIAPTDLTALIQGESGVGKEVIPRIIHDNSRRRGGRFLAVNCGAIPEGTINAELFGHEKGAFTGAIGERKGYFEEADGGTLFLDEIESLPKNLAAKLAANLLRGASQRVNEDVYRPIDVRIIAACDSDLKRLTERGLFDRDLYEIVARSIIRVPPLRSRREDIPELVRHIIAEQAELHQLPVKKISDDTLRLLESYDWPGNIKQLQHVVEQAFFNTAGMVIEPSDINLMGDIQPDTKWKEDRDIFVKAWQAAGGNVSRLANMLNVSRVTLYRYLKKYGLEKN